MRWAGRLIAAAVLIFAARAQLPKARAQPIVRGQPVAQAQGETRPAVEAGSKQPGAGQSGSTDSASKQGEPAAAPDEPVRPDAATEPKNGKPGVLLTGKDLEEYLKWRNGLAGPEYSVTSIELEGRAAADDEQATLTATITVQLNHDDQPLRVPLNLNEATLTGHTYQGDGTATPDADFQRETGYFWWFRGKGRHVLTLSMIVPIKKQLPTRRLQLTIPATAVSRLKLNVPIGGVTTKVTPKDAWVKTTPSGKTSTDLKVQWFGRRLDLSWEPHSPQEPEETVLQSRVVLGVNLTGESVVLEATQTIQALQGNFSEVSVRLPAGFELLDVEGSQYSDHEVGVGNHAAVTLSEPTKGPVELKWTLEAPFAAGGGKLTLEGFEIDRARRQQGEIAISGLDGFRITRRADEDRFVHRINVGELDGIEGVRTAYEFLKQPFRLVLDLAEIEPGFTVKPHLQLHVAPDRAELEAVFAFQVYRGAVPEILVHWPDAGLQGWEIETLGPPTLLDRDQVIEQLDEGLLRIPLLKRTKGEFAFRLKAGRSIPAPEKGDEAFGLSLPYVDASPRQPTVLDVFSAPNVEVELASEGATSIRLSEADKPPPGSLPEPFRGLQRTTYRIESQEHALTSTVKVHAREISASTAASARWDEQRLLVTQRISYNVAFEPLSQVLLLVPKDLPGPARFSLGEDVELLASSTLLDEGEFQELQLTLPEPQIGRFEIVARYLLDLPTPPAGGKSTTIKLPILQSSDAEFSSTRLEFLHGGGMGVSLADGAEEWKPQSSLQSSSVWQAVGAPRSVSLKLSDSREQPVQDFTVRKALIRSALDAGGAARSRAQYRIQGTVSTIALTIPRGEIVIDAIWWDERPLSAGDIPKPAGNDGTYRLSVAPALQPETGDHLLTVDFHSEEVSGIGWSRRHKLPAPRFASGVWIDESLWELELPGNQHLFTQPADFTPQFHWQRRGLIWSREPIPGCVEPADWIGGGGPGTPDAGRSAKSPESTWKSLGAESVNSYRFSRFGPVGEMTFRTMRFSFVVFLGAALSLATGFLLLYLPLTRNVLTFLTIALAVATIALWFPAPVELLLQPAVLGLVLAVACAMINNAVRREKRVPVLTLSSPSDYGPRIASAASASSVEPLGAGLSESGSMGAGSEDPTSLRQATSGERRSSEAREAVAAPESGSQL